MSTFREAIVKTIPLFITIFYIMPTIATGLLAKFHNVFVLQDAPFPGELVFIPILNILWAIMLFFIDLWFCVTWLMAPIIQWINI